MALARYLDIAVMPSAIPLDELPA